MIAACTLVALAGNAPAQEEPDPAASPPASAAELFELLGAGPEVFVAFADHEPLADDEIEPLLRVLYTLRRFQPVQLERHAQPDAALLADRDDSGPLRGELFRLDGRARRIAVEEAPPAEAERFELPRYYRCELEIGDPPRPAIVYTPIVPRTWTTGEPLDEPVTAMATVLKFVPSDDPRGVPMLAAPRIAWHPDTPLGRLGMDVGLLDDVRQRTPLVAADREAFYQLLAAVRRAPPGALLAEAGDRPTSVIPLFNDPAAQVGRLVLLRGTTRRVQRIVVDDEQIRQRFGIDDYYEIDMFTVDSEGNPITVCVPTLPAGLPQGDNVREDIRVAAFFYKVWAYRARATEPGQRQLAPLLIGAQPEWIQPEPGSPYLGAIAGGVFVIFLLGLWLVLWKAARRDRRRHERILASRYRLDEGQSLDDLGADDSDRLNDER